MTERLCREFAVDNADTLWDHLVEAVPDDELAERLTAYFDLVRGESVAGEDDRAREEYMASWVRAADGPVVVVTGGFHTPAIRALAVGEGPWPEVPQPPADAIGGSYLVPYSHKRLDAEAISAGAFCLLRKPFETGALLECLDRSLRR